MDDIGREPAFPVHPNGPIFRGMTYRQWLVGMALQGLIANSQVLGSLKDVTADFDELKESLSWMAITQADSVIYEMERYATFQPSTPAQSAG